jgi:predicted DsbA family dithiol-disulfide isomerase
LSLRWKSYLIRGEGVTTFDDYIASHFRRANEQEEGIIFNPWRSGPYPRWGMPALMASKAAELQGKEKWRTFHLAVMKAFYTDSRDISCLAVLEEIGRESGLDMESFTGGMRDPRFEAEVYEETRQAQDRYGIRAIPAVVVDNRFLVEGAVPLSRYQQALHEARSTGSPEHPE